MLKGKHIVVGVTGSIAAYKTASLIRLLTKEGAEVKVIMTEMGKQFITPLTLATVSKNPILVEFYNPENGDWNSHVSLGQWSDLLLIAPASANTIAKMATGVADNLLLTTYLSATSPIAIAPAMDLDMYRHPITQKNLKSLSNLGVHLIEPGDGELASGLIGKGRMEEPEMILESVISILNSERESRDDETERGEKLVGRRVLITAGPTVEKIDPVRYISNYSSGKMGYALAEEAHSQGGEVTIVSGPVTLPPPSGAEVIPVESAEQMYQATLKEYQKGYDIVIFAAAVADYTPITEADDKIKSDSDQLTLTLKGTKDIAASLSNQQRDGTLHIGFALESSNEVENAIEKLKRKGLDAIIFNSLQDEGAGFGVDTNRVTIIGRDGIVKKRPLMEKREVAKEIIDYIVTTL